MFIAYSATDNAWRRMPTPKWAEPLKWFHAYENNAADSARGVFYHHSSASGLVHQYVVAKEKWSTLPELKAPAGHGTALEYFPEMKGLVRVLNGEVWFWSEEKDAWSRLATKLEMGPYHNFASYSPHFKVVIFGGGNDSGAIHLLNADGKIATGMKSPVDLGIGRSLNVVDPASGELLVLTKEQKLLAYHPGKDALGRSRRRDHSIRRGPWRRRRGLQGLPRRHKRRADGSLQEGRYPSQLSMWPSHRRAT